METVHLSPRKFIIGCAFAASALFLAGFAGWTRPAWVAIELFATILGLFLLGSFRYQLDKNALTYGMGMVILGTFLPLWWPASSLKETLAQRGPAALADFTHHHFLTLQGLEGLFHADTMLFILGLTFFVSVIAQTRLLETISGNILRRQKGRVFRTVALLAVIVAASSGVLDGVSMIGLMIRTLVIILALGRAQEKDMIFAVIVSTVITTVSGMWMAYGEPPNLIMKANLYPHLDNAFFLRYCLPVAVGSYLIVVWNLRKRLGRRRINMAAQDILDTHNADLRFLQASRHGEVLTPVGLLDAHKEELGERFASLQHRVLQGEPLGEALLEERVPPGLRRKLLGHFVSEELAKPLEEHYEHLLQNRDLPRDASEIKVRQAIEAAARPRLDAQKIGALSFIPFVGLLIAHAVNHDIPLFIASFAGFVVAFLGIYAIPKMRALALRDAAHEFKEYLFLFPLFLSIAFLQRMGFFDRLAHLLQDGISRWGASHVAYFQYWGATFLSAILDNNVVADFAARALHGLDVGLLHLFAMAQIAGYAVGGCWTHIGCAQSVVAYAFIRKEINPRYTPLQWIKAMTWVVLQLSAFVTLVIYLEGWLLNR